MTVTGAGKSNDENVVWVEGYSGEPTQRRWYVDMDRAGEEETEGTAVTHRCLERALKSHYKGLYLDSVAFVT